MTDDIATLRRILRDCRTIAVVGLSADWHRPSNFAAAYMQHKGYRIVPVNPRYAGTRVLGEPCVATLDDIAEAGLATVMDRCVKIEHARLFGGLHWAGVNTRVISSHRPT